MDEEIIKYHKTLLEIIAQFKKPKSGKLISKSEAFSGKKARFKPYKKEFKIEFEYDIFSKNRKELRVGKYHKGMQIQFGKKTYNLENVFLGTHAPPRVVASVDSVHTIGFSEKKKYYYQLVIPLEKEMRFHFNIEETIFRSDLGYRSRTGTTATINQEPIQVCCIHNEKKEYFLAIDSPIKQTFNEFAEKANAVNIGMGYLAGYYAGNQGFFFAYTRKEKKEPSHFRCNAFRDSIKSGYNPVY